MSSEEGAWNAAQCSAAAGGASSFINNANNSIIYYLNSNITYSDSTATTTASCDEQQTKLKVFIWDLDETLIIFHSLLTGAYTQQYGKNTQQAIQIGLQMEEMIFEIADKYLFFNDLEDCDQVHIDDLTADDNGIDLTNYSFLSDGFNHQLGVRSGVEWMRKLAYRYRRIRQVYSTCAGTPLTLMSESKRQSWSILRNEFEQFTDHWSDVVHKLLTNINNRTNCVNIVVTTTQLVPALSKLLVYDISRYILIDNVYSATKIGKRACFERIMNRFGRDCCYIVIGDGADEQFAANSLRLPAWNIGSRFDMQALLYAIHLDLI